VGQIETGTKRQTDYQSEFWGISWADKLDLNEGQEFIPASINQEK
jgi:hypothetical protein